MKKYYLIILLLSTIIVSCTSDLELSNSYEDLSNQPSDNLTTMIVNFYNDVNSQKTRSNESNLNIKNISKKYFDIKNGSEVVYSTRGTGEDFSISIVSFEIDSKEGYCYISEVNGRNDVLFFTDNGHITDTIQNTTLKIILDSLPSKVANNICSSPDDPGDGDGDGGGDGNEDPDDEDPNPNPFADQESGIVNSYVKGPFLNTKWGQGFPYNNLVPYCDSDTCKITHRKPLGCVATALAQVIAYVRAINGETLYQQLTSNPYPMVQQYDVLAIFCYDIAIGCKMDFNCDGSSSDLAKASNHLSQLGIPNTYYNLPDVHNLIVSSINRSLPLILSGTRLNGNIGHAWLVDGVKYTRWKEDGVYYHYYCNWGWNGDSDGWLIDYALAKGSSSDPNNSKYYPKWHRAITLF